MALAHIEAEGPQEYAAPATLEEAARLAADGAATLLAGGTDLMLRAAGSGYGRRLVNLRRIRELDGIEIGESRVRLGALVTVTEILETDTLRAAVPLLAETADRFASPQIRNAATLGGNIANASPAADLVVPLLALDAEVTLAAWRDEAMTTRRLPLAEVFTGPGTTVIGADEILTAVAFDRPTAGQVGGFLKSGPRPALEIAVVSAALAGVLRDGALHQVRIALGSVAPTPIRAHAAEAVLEGQPLTPDTIDAAAQAAAGEAAPIDDIRGSAWYRRHLVRVYLERLLADVLPG
jgi:CO/xanthine dehydrogenase FAD-binding subunit